MSDALKRSLQWMLLSLAAFSAAAAPVKHAINERSADARDVQVLLQARSTSVDLKGTAWIYHGVTGLPHDPMAAAVTAVRPDGSTRTYLATDILPRGLVAPGKVGLVFAITPLTTPGMFAATAGWFDGDGRPKNAVVFFREASDGTLTNYAVVPAPGARAIAAGPQDSAVVATLDPLHNGETNLVTIINANGTVMSTWGPFETANIAAANDRIAAVRFHQLDDQSIAVYDAAAQRVGAFRIFAPENCAFEKTAPSEKPRAMALGSNKVRFGVTDLWTVPVSDTSDSGADEVLPAIGFAATKEGEVTVVRPIVVDERPRTLVTRYTPRGRERSWSSDHFWRAALVSPAEARGIVQKATPWEERVSLAE
ncbi:MAG TPA: hypothetical protein VEO54_00080 [Thermoanaerobaculia bacterium]|nr:hypothetical protein [Thermoanaerobaculia bacterium]